MGVLRRLRIPIVTALLLLVWIAASVKLAADDWPEWRGKGRLGVWRETGVLDTLPNGGLPVSWRAPIYGGYAGPAVAGGRVFVTDSRRVKANRAIERTVAMVVQHLEETDIYVAPE